MAEDGSSNTAKVISLGGAETANVSPKTAINDSHFIRDLTRLKELRSFLIREAVNVSDPTALSFGRLNLLQFRADGEAPTLEEWSELELHTRTLFGFLTEPLRRRFVLGEIPGWLGVLAGALALASLSTLIIAERMAAGSPTYEALGVRILPFYLIWTMSLGTIGSVAFIGMNALSVQNDITFDPTSSRLMTLRIVLGAVFGLVLTLPFGFPAFEQFLAVLCGWGDDVKKGLLGTPATFTTQALLLLLPFILGFSTSLVIIVLNRFIDSAQAFFGKMGVSEPAQASASSSSRSSMHPKR